MEFLTHWLAFTPVFALPLIAASLGLIVNERAGLLNLGAEGIMLCGALVGVAAFIEFDGNAALGFIFAIISGTFLGFCFGFFTVVLRSNQVLTGITFVFLGAGLTGLIGIPWVNKAISVIDPIHIPFLTDIPVIGRFLFGQDYVVYITAGLVILVWRFLYHTRTGLRLRAVGENPQAADAAGINVEGYRLLAATIGGAFMGLAGGYLSLVIFSRWRPFRAVLGGLLFGGIEALIPRLQAEGYPIPQYFMAMAPYAVTLFVLIYAAVQMRAGQDAPRALGTPYVREDRK